MNRLRDFRTSLQADLEGSVDREVEFRVATGATAFGDGGELDRQIFDVVAIVGEATADTEDFLDELLDANGEFSLKTLIEHARNRAGAIDVRVSRTSGSRGYPQGNGVVFIGAEWKIEALFN